MLQADNKSWLRICGLLLALSLASSVSAQKFWEKKPYTEWSESEVLRLLDGSPWAQTQVTSSPDTDWVTIRLRSAVPVRQALVRQRQIRLNYDKFTPADKERFAAEVKTFLECPDCGNYLWISLTSSVNDPYMLRAVTEFPLDQLKPLVSLVNDQGERRDLVNRILSSIPGREVTLVFDRFDEQGRPFLDSSNQKFYFKIDDKVFSKLAFSIKKFTFSVSTLVRNGEIQF